MVRTHNQHLTQSEIDVLFKCFTLGNKASYAATQVSCSTRCAQKYYRFFQRQGQVAESDPIKVGGVEENA